MSTASETGCAVNPKRGLVENWHTSEACAWISNDEPLYLAALRCRKTGNPYAQFLRIVGGDRVGMHSFLWTDKRIQRTLVNAFIRSLE